MRRVGVYAVLTLVWLLGMTSLGWSGSADTPRRRAVEDLLKMSVDQLETQSMGTLLGGDPDCALPGSAPLAVRLRLPDGPRGFPVKPTQRVERGRIVLFPGETLCVEASSQADAVGGFALVATVADWKKTIVVRLWQMAGRMDMLLVVSNPFPTFLKYRAIMVVPFEDRSQHTSSCPVGPERVVVEHWPHPIVQLTLSEFRLKANGSACE